MHDLLMESHRTKALYIAGTFHCADENALGASMRSSIHIRVLITALGRGLHHRARRQVHRTQFSSITDVNMDDPVLLARHVGLRCLHGSGYMVLAHRIRCKVGAFLDESGHLPDAVAL